MKFQRTAIVVTVLNLLLLLFVLAQVPSTAQPSVSPLVRARAIELVDEHGKIRAQLNVESTGEVVFRLRDSKGTIRSKYGAGDDGSGLSLMDERTEATVQIRANRSGGSMAVYNRDGQERVIK